MPTGSYTLNYNSDGPTGAVLTGISPSPNQTLRASGAITCTLNFTSQQKVTVKVNATIKGDPWKGDQNYVVYRPYVESGSRVPRSFDNSPSGGYSVEYNNGGQPQSRFLRVVSSSIYLPPGGRINFKNEFEFIGLPDPMPGPLNDPENEKEIMPSN